MAKRILVLLLAVISVFVFASCSKKVNTLQINDSGKRLTDFSQIITYKDLESITGYTFSKPVSDSEGNPITDIDTASIPSDKNSTCTRNYYLPNDEIIMISVSYYEGDIQKFEQEMKSIQDVEITDWDGVNVYWDSTNQVMLYLVKSYVIEIAYFVVDEKAYDNAKQIGKLIFDRTVDILE